MAKFDMCVWYSEVEYGKAWTTIEADSVEEAEAILEKAMADDTPSLSDDLEWDFDPKGSEGVQWDYESGITTFKQKES
tara:strand:+ start:18329 stop:18562 length:234 start_codon:yes stop_codon:yes gene_type:complete